ncbi:MAG: hypothetical protein ABIP71_11610 [Verrucomicrobiota bacterium]
MSSRAHVTSVEALEAFRANLIVYLSKARPTLEEVSDQVIRTRVWLESTQRVYWQSQARQRTQKFQDAQQTLFSAELSNLREVSSAERMAVQKAKRALEEAEEKLKRIKKWDRDFGSQVEPLARQLEKLQTVLANNLPDAIAFLAGAVKSLDAYNQDVRSGNSSGESSAIPAASELADESNKAPEEP